MKKNIIVNFKIICLQRDTYCVSCKLEKSIPKGIIVYYPLVSFIYAFFWKISFDRILFFSILKKIKKTYILFFMGSIGSLVPFNRINRLEVDFGTEPEPDGTNYLKCKINSKSAIDYSKFRARTPVKHPSKYGQQKFLASGFMFRKSFLFSHPPPKARNRCQQWYGAKSMMLVTDAN